MSTLPIEIIRQIVEDIDDDVDDLVYDRDLWGLSLSCRLLRHEAQRVLFRNPALPILPALKEKTMMFLDTIILSPDRLALYVKGFKITYSSWMFLDNDEFVKKLSRALQAMHNLKVLDVDNHLDSIRSLPNALEGVHFKLTSFRWSGYPQHISDAGSIKTNFLQHQDEIEHLVLPEFIDKHTLGPVAADICPRLRSLSAPYPITQLFLPNKKHLTSLQWTTDPDFNTPADLNSISNGLTNLKYLAYGDTSDDYTSSPRLQNIAPYLKNLVCLETSIGDIKRVKALSHLTHLKFLVLTKGNCSGFPGIGELMAVVIACKTLERMYIQNRSRYVRFTSYRGDRSTERPRIYQVDNDLDASQTIVWAYDYNTFDA